MLDLALGNLLTLVTEFVAIRAGSAYFGVPPLVAIAVGTAVMVAAICSRRYFTWERVVLTLSAANLLFIPVALLARPDPGAVARAFGTLSPIPGGLTMAFFTLVLANIGATVTPWMLFFQQSAVVDKGLSRSDLRAARWDTAVGAVLAALVAVAASVLFEHHVDVSQLNTGADFATALQPFIGHAGASLFALGMIEAGLVAGMTIGTSSAYGVGEVLGCGKSLNSDFGSRRVFYVTCAVSLLIAGGVVLMPHAPLLALSINVITTLLMAPATLFVLLFANDGDHGRTTQHARRQRLRGLRRRRRGPRGSSLRDDDDLPSLHRRKLKWHPRYWPRWDSIGTR